VRAERGHAAAWARRSIALLQELGSLLQSQLAESPLRILGFAASPALTQGFITACLARWPRCRALHQPRNLGQATALLDGLRSARGEILLAMDGDGQNDPRDFPLLLAPVEADTLDVACGWRHDRHDSWLRRKMSRLANFVRSRVLGDHLHDSGCQLRVLRRATIAALFPFELLQSFLPAILIAAGFRLGEFKVRHHPRTRGQANYGLRQLWLRPTLAMLRLRRRLRASVT
jgi:glycosyltransferase involved in cell wall biosynthesis